MTYLSETTPIYSYMEGGRTHTYEHTEVEWDDNSGEYYVKDGPHGLMSDMSRPAKWWCVAVYDTWTRYGGPEEGGWYYQCGSLVEHSRIRFFDNYAEAEEYLSTLWDWCGTQPARETGLIARSYTERMPDAFFPKTRPYYC
jgi:hypothetical protein